MPHESESNMLMEDDDIEYDFVMPTTCCDDYDWEDNDVSYDLENLFGTRLEEYDNNVYYTIAAIHAINKNDYDDMQNHKLWDAMFDEYEMFEDLFAENNACPKLGMLCIMNMILLFLLLSIRKFIMMIACLLFMMITMMKVGLEECQL